MKKLLALFTALLLVLCALTPALAEEAVDAAPEAVEVAEETAEAAEEAAPEPSSAFNKLLEVPWYAWVVVAALIAAAITLIVLYNKGKIQFKGKKIKA